MQRVKTAFLCSRNTPDGIEFLVGKWLLGLSAERDCVMCGNQSPMERAVFSVLLERKIPAILVLAEAMRSRWEDDISAALRENRLLIITHCDASVHSVTARSAFDRNVLMLSLAQNTVVGYCKKGGKLERALAGFDNVEYLENGQPWLGMTGKAAEDTVADKPRQTRLGAWQKRLDVGHGTIFLDFNDSSAETFFKITHSTGDAGGGFVRQKLFFDRKELAAFLSALRLLDDGRSKGEAVWTSLKVDSLSGEITFDVIRRLDSSLLRVTQTKENVGGKLRVNTVSLDYGELPVLMKGVEEALAEWK